MTLPHSLLDHPEPDVSHLRRPFLSLLRTAVLAVLVALPAVAPVGAQDAPAVNPDTPEYIVPPPEIAEILGSDKNYAELSYASPDGVHFLITDETELSSLELMSRETYRLAMLELRPRTDRTWRLDTYGIQDVRFYSLEERELVEVELPEGAFASDFTWSPDGSEIAFLAHLPSHTEVWVAEAATGETRSLSGDRVLATLATEAGGWQGRRASSMVQWTPEGTVLSLLVPEGRGAEPAEDRIPQGPVIRQTREEPKRTRTYPFLLDDPYDEELFEHYTAAQLAELGDGDARPLGPPRMYRSLSVSPDGEHVLATFIKRPFSYITAYNSFPHETAVLDRDGGRVATLVDRPLEEGREDFDFPEEIAWRPDGEGLSYIDEVPSEDEEEEATWGIWHLDAPFDLDAAELVATSPDPVEDVAYSQDGAHLFAHVNDGDDRALAYWDLASGGDRVLLQTPWDTEDPLENAGDLLVSSTGNGLAYAPVSSDGSATFVSGPGYAADFRPTPFVDRVALDGSGATRVFEGAKDSYDRPLVPLNADMTRMVASREGMRDFPDSWLWEDGTFVENLTENEDPFPGITAVERMDFSFTRRDGLEVQGRVSMPVGWEPGDDPVPAMFWTYPREYVEAEEYTHDAIEDRNHNAFTHMSWLRWSDMWLAAGYALVHPDIPIVGENYNDTYIASLVDAMYGAIRAVDGLDVVDVDRLAHGGHSYGAFATANVVANAPYFKAGIAGNGAYNRSLTPDGFQAERRSVWEAPSTYIEMSPFFRADQIETPILFYHGADDDNSGTFPVQSRRMISALTILGKEAVLYEYPYESHTPRSIENKMDMWARFVDWLDTHLQESDPAAATISEQGSR